MTGETIPGGDGFVGRETIVVVEKSDHRVAFYDLASGTLETTVACSDFPHEMIVDRAGRFAYVSEYGLPNSSVPGDGGSSVLVIDLTGRTSVRRLDCRPHGRIHGIRMDERGRVFALSERDDLLLVFDRPDTDTRPRRAVATGGRKGHLFALRPDGQRAWCMNLLSHTVTRVAPFDDDVAPVALAPGRKPEGIYLSPAGDRLYATNREDDELVAICPETMSVLGRYRSGLDPTRVYGTATGLLLVTAFGGREVLLHDPATLEIVDRLALPASPISASFHPDRSEAYLSLDSDELLVLRLDGLVVRSRFATGREPDCSALLR